VLNQQTYVKYLDVLIDSKLLTDVQLVRTKSSHASHLLFKIRSYCRS